MREPPAADLFERVRALGACRHAGGVVSLSERGAAWCTHCGSIRVALERADGEIVREEWFAPGLVRGLVRSVSAALGDPDITPAARACLDFVFSRGPQDAGALSARYGASALLELATANLIDIDHNGAVFARGDMPAPYDSQVRIACASPAKKGSSS